MRLTNHADFQFNRSQGELSPIMGQVKDLPKGIRVNHMREGFTIEDGVHDPFRATMVFGDFKLTLSTNKKMTQSELAKSIAEQIAMQMGTRAANVLMDDANAKELQDMVVWTQHHLPATDSKYFVRLPKTLSGPSATSNPKTQGPFIDALEIRKPQIATVEGQNAHDEHKQLKKEMAAVRKEAEEARKGDFKWDVTSYYSPYSRASHYGSTGTSNVVATGLSFELASAKAGGVSNSFALGPRRIGDISGGSVVPSEGQGDVMAQVKEAGQRAVDKFIIDNRDRIERVRTSMEGLPDLRHIEIYDNLDHRSGLISGLV